MVNIILVHLVDFQEKISDRFAWIINCKEREILTWRPQKFQVEVGVQLKIMRDQFAYLREMPANPASMSLHPAHALVGPRNL